MARALLLNASFEPLCVVSSRRAVVLVLKDKAEIVHRNGAEMRSERRSIPVPTVIRLVHFVRVPFRATAPLSRRAVFARDDRPLDPRCDCRTCTTFSRAYLRHLHMSGEILAARALTEHNLYFYGRLMREAQAAIASGTYGSYAKYTLGLLSEGEVLNEAKSDVV